MKKIKEIIELLEKSEAPFYEGLKLLKELKEEIMPIELANQKEAEAVDGKTGLTSLEQECYIYLQQSFNAYRKLKVQHPDEIRDFVDAIHSLQGLLAIRIARRTYPNGWITHAPEENPSA